MDSALSARRWISGLLGESSGGDDGGGTVRGTSPGHAAGGDGGTSYCGSRGSSGGGDGCGSKPRSGSSICTVEDPRCSFGGGSGRRPPAMAMADSSWSADLKAYERSRRREADIGLFQGPPPRLTKAMIFHAEQTYNPLTQEFREGQREARQRAFEDKVRVEHLNRARDIQMRREQQHNVVNHEDRLAPLLASGDQHKQVEPLLVDDQVNNPSIPKTYADYNIVSNLPFDDHHWDLPEHRPLPRQRNPKQRLIPAVEIKDFNIVSNRYKTGHEDKTYRDQALNLLEATEKFRRRNRFDPVLQRLTDARAEANLQSAEHAATAEKVLQAEASMPLCYQGRATASYNLVSHEVNNPEMLSRLEAAEEARNSRHFTKHAIERNAKLLEVMAEDAAAQQRLGQVSHQRFEEVTNRGYDIVTNRPFGTGPKYQKLHPPYTKPEASIWEKVEANREDLPDVGGSTSRGQDLCVTRKIDATAAAVGSGVGSSSAHGTAAATTADASGSHSISGRGSSKTPRVKPASDRASSAAAASSGAASARGPRPRRGEPSFGASTPRAEHAAVLHSAAPQAVAPPAPVQQQRRQQLRAPPAPEVPGTPVGSVYSRRRP